jgi:hypothetical protein
MNVRRKAAIDYIATRRALGFKLARSEKLLAQFISYLEKHGGTHNHDRDGDRMGCPSTSRADMVLR